MQQRMEGTVSPKIVTISVSMSSTGTAGEYTLYEGSTSVPSVQGVVVVVGRAVRALKVTLLLVLLALRVGVKGDTGGEEFGAGSNGSKRSSNVDYWNIRNIIHCTLGRKALRYFPW